MGRAERERLIARLAAQGETPLVTVDVHLERWLMGRAGPAALALTPGRLWWAASSPPVVASLGLAGKRDVVWRERRVAGPGGLPALVEVRITGGRDHLRFTAADGRELRAVVTVLRGRPHR